MPSKCLKRLSLLDNMLYSLARPKRFELLTPKFVVGTGLLNLKGFPANRTRILPKKINRLRPDLQTAEAVRRTQKAETRPG